MKHFSFALALSSIALLSACNLTRYTAKYDMGLSEVVRPQQAQQRYGKQTITPITDDEKSKYVFEDSLVKIIWFPTPSQIYFEITNKTDNSVKIVWDDAAFVDEKGRSHRVMHSGVRFSEAEKSMTSSVIARRGTLSDLIYPSDYARLISSSWVENPLISPLLSGYLTTDDKRGLKSFIEQAKANEGNVYQVLLPLQIQDVVNEYTFAFKVGKVDVFTTDYTEKPLKKVTETENQETEAN